MTQPASSPIDRIADVALRLLAYLGWLVFFCWLAVAIPVARARAADCTGKDLLAEMATSDPAGLEALRREAATIANGKGIFWKIEKPGIAASYLYGTMHLTDPRVLALPAAALDAYTKADTVVIETDEIVDPKAPLRLMAEEPDLMMLPAGSTLERLLPQDQLEAVRAGLAKRGMPLGSVNRMQPWVLTSVLALPACELARKKGGAAFLDLQLAQDALSRGQKLAGLETMKDQLQVMAALPVRFHVGSLVELIALGPRIDDLFETMTILYMRGDTGMIMPLMRSVSREGALDDADYADFEQRLITTRNATMVERAMPIIDRGNAFIAIGALHLPGEKGLIALLQQRNYQVTPQ
ncbi:TraB/GumN family protein [Phyllobacterium sp. 21LDTY02-6]|uniref:TraB/GumN family protein n=1 Tax=Phyllobacterium sp. 21LDTY02-6 TaxID=2944903 RepID=UPI0020207A7D|nr:TraB/GumN family protein [Phyllobacterium sp. 21LDTY02-6]MCO4317386.1 TraB/GumN family protein [Phyllobacterium sp. 21LDTY02-6]